jgi:hypothetical protein
VHERIAYITWNGSGGIYSIHTGFIEGEGLQAFLVLGLPSGIPCLDWILTTCNIIL